MIKISFKNMKFFIFLVVVLLMVGCTTASVMMTVDPFLAENAQIYDVSSESKFFDARLNVSFGDYHVAEVDTRSMKTRKPDAPDLLWLRFMIWIFNLDCNCERTEVSTTHTYQFKVGDEAIWDAKCSFVAEEGEVKEVNNAIITNVGDKVSIKTLSSYYKCRYTAADQEQWVLTIEWRRGHPETDIKMTHKDEHFEAYVTGGEYVAADGREVWGKPSDVGYSWRRDNKSVSAISIQGKPPRVWLHKDNPKLTNDALSMGSAGLFIYHKEIVPTLKK